MMKNKLLAIKIYKQLIQALQEINDRYKDLNVWCDIPEYIKIENEVFYYIPDIINEIQNPDKDSKRGKQRGRALDEKAQTP